MKLVRVLALVLVFSLLVVGIGVHAQDGVTMVIGWEQTVDRPSMVSTAAFSAYVDNFFSRGNWGWFGADRTIEPIMAAEIPTIENGDVTLVDVMYDDDSNPDTPDVAGQAPVVTVHLRQGMLWSDGEPITSADCMFEHNLLIQPNPVDSAARGDYPDVVASATAPDDYTFVTTFNRPYPDYIEDIATCGNPAHKFLGDNAAGFTMDQDGDGVFDNNVDNAPYNASYDPIETIGYGPYVLSTFEPGASLTLTKNPNWGANAWEQVPAIDTIILQFIEESEQMENALQVGDIDMAYNWNYTTSQYPTMDNVTTFVTDSVYADALWMNSGPNSFPAMQDVRVRQAITHAINRRDISEQVIGPGSGALIPRSWFASSFVPDDLPFLEYDVDQARQLLTDAGWVDDDNDESADNTAPTLRVSSGVDGVADGTPLILRFYTTPRVPRPDVQTLAQAQLAAVGIRTQLFVVSGPTVLFASFAERGVLYTGNYDLAIYALSNDPLSPNSAPDNFYCSGIPSQDNPNGQNNTWFCDPEYDRLDTLVHQTVDATQRLEFHHQLEPLFFNATVWEALFPRPEWYAVRNDRFNPDSMMDMGTLSNNYFNRVEFWQPAS